MGATTPPGGQGETPSRSDLELYRQALRNDWPIPQRVRVKVLQTLVDLVDDGEDDDDDDAGPVAAAVNGFLADNRNRLKVAAARALAAFAGLNIAQQSLELKREALELARLKAEAEARDRRELLELKRRELDVKARAGKGELVLADQVVEARRRALERKRERAQP